MGAVVASGAGRRSRGVIGRWVLLLVALGGLFAMHGLSDHGVGAPVSLGSPVAHVEAHTAAGHEVGAGMASTEGEQDAAGVADLPVDRPAGSGDHHGDVLAGMCLAVLAVALLLGSAGGRARVLVRLRQVLADDPALAAAAAFWARARGPAPPDLTSLSIQRC